MTAAALGPGHGGRRSGRPCRERRLDDRGSEAVEVVLIIPVLMLLLLAGLQLALWGLASHALALGVADGGAAAHAQAGSVSAARTVVGDLHAVGGSLVHAVSVAVRDLPDGFIAVSASGAVPSIFPGVHLHVSAVSVGPVQGFRAGG